jgi:hypothetical protein
MGTSCPIVPDASVDCVISNGVVNLAPRVAWRETLVANDNVYCVFRAESAKLLE